MKFKNTTLIVSDIKQSKIFYRDILGLHVTIDFGFKVTLTSGLCLQTFETWKDLTHKESTFVNDAFEICFETEDIDVFVKKLNHYNIPMLHGLKEQHWGQRVVRFYDPDGHIIEVGESLKKVAKRFLNQGLSYEEIAKKMGIPLETLKRSITNG